MSIIPNTQRATQTLTNYDDLPFEMRQKIASHITDAQDFAHFSESDALNHQASVKYAEIAQKRKALIDIYNLKLSYSRILLRKWILGDAFEPANLDTDQFGCWLQTCRRYHHISDKFHFSERYAPILAPLLADQNTPPSKKDQIKDQIKQEIVVDVIDCMKNIHIDEAGYFFKLLIEVNDLKLPYLGDTHFLSKAQASDILLFHFKAVGELDFSQSRVGEVYYAINIIRGLYKLSEDRTKWPHAPTFDEDERKMIKTLYRNLKRIANIKDMAHLAR